MEFLLEIQERSKFRKFPYCPCAQVISLWKIQFTHQTSIWGTFFISLEQVLHSAQSMIAQCGSYAILLLSQFFHRNSVKSTFLLTNHIVNWFHKKFSSESEFLFLPHCVIDHKLDISSIHWEYVSGIFLLLSKLVAFLKWGFKSW